MKMRDVGDEITAARRELNQAMAHLRDPECPASEVLELLTVVEGRLRAVEGAAHNAAALASAVRIVGAALGGENDY